LSAATGFALSDRMRRKTKRAFAISAMALEAAHRAVRREQLPSRPPGGLDLDVSTVPDALALTVPATRSNQPF